MFYDLSERTVGELSVVRSSLRTTEALRTLLFAELDPEQAEHLTFLRSHLGTSPPEPTGWRIFDHSAGITRLYAIYERCVNDVVRGWLIALPTLVPRYSDLDPAVRNAHRRGIARILENVDRERFKHLVECAFVKVFHDAVSGAEPYELMPDAFLFKDANFRKDILENTFASVAIERSWSWITGSRFVEGYLQRVGLGSTTVESELRKFVQYRNDAAHGSVDQIVGLTAMLELTDFVQAVCTALCELATSQVLFHRAKRGTARRLGKLTERLEKPNAVIGLMNEAEIEVGEKCFVTGPNCCFAATITSIQLDGVNHQKISVPARTEVGFQFDCHVPKNRDLWRW